MMSRKKKRPRRVLSRPKRAVRLKDIERISKWSAERWKRVESEFAGRFGRDEAERMLVSYHEAFILVDRFVSGGQGDREAWYAAAEAEIRGLAADPDPSIEHESAVAQARAVLDAVRTSFAEIDAVASGARRI